MVEEQPVTLRFIPAGAGNTYRCWLVANTQRVYPRWRREHS
ncbi:hypothetical protein HMPREF1608_04637 [Escherichia coli 908525]|nr:hypothetical protein HMPREF1608_04637 [Escherichia coli 908525]